MENYGMLIMMIGLVVGIYFLIASTFGGKKQKFRNIQGVDETDGAHAPIQISPIYR